MVGVDEVGRGCLAGPLLVVAARAKGELPAGLKDSKLLSRIQRDNFYKILIACCNFGEGWVSATEINKIGLGKSLKLGVTRALQNLHAKLEEEIIMDGIVNYVPKEFINSRCEAKADNNYPIVSAASIIAKVTRDKFMCELALTHPNFGFEKHVGYGTAEHLKAIRDYGALEFVHRMNFAPLKEMAA